MSLPSYEPMLATAYPKEFDDDDWWFDVKWDGFRCIAYVGPAGAHLRSRNGKDLGGRYPELTSLSCDRPAVIDGEIVAIGPDGKPSFFLLGQTPAQLAVFDLLHLDEPLIGLPLEDRWERLASLELTGSVIRSTPVEGAGEALFDAVVGAGLEGIVAKKSGSRYLPGRRSSDWRKVVHRSTIRAVVGGYMKGDGGRADTFGSLIVGLYSGGDLYVAGAAGSGLDERSLRLLLPLLKATERPTSPFAEKVDLPGVPVWVTPTLVVMVEYREWTPYRRLRAPVYKGLAHDVDPSDVTWDSEAPRWSPREVAATMAEVVVFHHALGVTDRIEQFAAEVLADAGHTVYTPDLFDGRTFDTIEDGMAYSEEIGGPMAIVDRAREAVDALSNEIVFVGFSLGVLAAQSLAQTRPGARGAVLCYAALPLGEWGENWPETWPEGVRLQMHILDGDEDFEFAQGLAATVPEAELFAYPGTEHYFAEHDEEAAALLTQRVLGFLG